MRNISKRITSLIFFNIYTPPQHFFQPYNSLSFKIIDKANSKFDLKIEEALHINWTKPNLNGQQNYLALILSLQLPSPNNFKYKIFKYISTTKATILSQFLVKNLKQFLFLLSFTFWPCEFCRIRFPVKSNLLYFFWINIKCLLLT